MKIKLILVAILFAVFGFRLWQTTGCKSLNSFHLNLLTVKIRVEEQRNLDLDQNSLESKIINNKITVGIFERAKIIASVFSLNFLISILSPLGLYALIVTLLNINRKTNRLIFLNLAYVVMSAFLLMFLNPVPAFYNFAFSLFTLSLWSVKFIKVNLMVLAVLAVLFIASLLFYSIDWQMPQICNAIFFN